VTHHPIRIAPSILAANLVNLGADVERAVACAASPASFLASPDAQCGAAVRFSTASAMVAAASFAQVMFARSDNRPSGNRTRHIPAYFWSGTARANSMPLWRVTQAVPFRTHVRLRRL